MRRPTPPHPISVVLVGLAVAACGGAARREPVVAFQRPAGESYVIGTPAKAQLVDGSTVLYPQGVTVTADALQGSGRRFTLTLAAGDSVTRVPFDSVVALVSVSPLVAPKKRIDSEASVPITMGIIVVLFTIFSISGSK